MIVPANYHGREQAFVKHRLLETYLERLFMIIGPHQRNIRYVDCFSGPWQEGSHDLQDTSIGISLEIMRKCRDGLKNRGINVRFQALFIEKDKRAFEKLEAHLNSYTSSEVITTAYKGEFYDLRMQILNWCKQDDFTFFFIDPTGWKNVVEISTLVPFLKRPNSEFLINFMYDNVLRTHTQKHFNEHMRAIFGEVPDTDGLFPEQKEEYLVHLYRKRLKEILPSGSGKPRAVSVPVLYPTIDRTLYHLVYLTRHPKGITVFMEASEHLDLIQRRVRAEAKQEKRESRSGQLELFQASENVSREKRADPAEVKAYWLNRLSTSPSYFGIHELADMLEETDWFESDFQAAFHELEREGKVQNLDAVRKRRTKFIHFSTGERLSREIS